MKKILVAILVMALTICLCACSVSDNAHEHEDHFSEWVSPDGVHYWLWEPRFSNKSGIVPRYGSNGQLIIDEVTE